MGKKDKAAKQEKPGKQGKPQSKAEKLTALARSKDPDTRSKIVVCPVCFKDSGCNCHKVHRNPGGGLVTTAEEKKTVHPERIGKARRRGVL